MRPLGERERRLRFVCTGRRSHDLTPIVTLSLSGPGVDGNYAFYVFQPKQVNERIRLIRTALHERGIVLLPCGRCGPHKPRQAQDVRRYMRKRLSPGTVTSIDVSTGAKLP